MELPPLRNDTGTTAGLFAVITSQGWSLLAVIKQRFEVLAGGDLRPLRDAVIRTADEPWSPDDAATSSIKYPHDLAPSKWTTDVVIVGDAVAPGERPVRMLDVHVQVGDVARSLSVLGPRRWYDAGGRVTLTEPAPFTRAPIRWENAFGGMDASDPDRPLEEPRNPIGCGLARDPLMLVGQPGPQVEDPTDPVQSARSRPAPAGLGAIGPSFAPRRNLAGTYDDTWVRQRMPLPPLDFDDRFHQCAPPELQSKKPMRGGETVRLLGLHRDGPVEFRLPRRAFSVEVPFAGSLEDRDAVLDTVLVEPNDLRVELTWRVCLAWPWARPAQAPLRIRAQDGAT